MFITPRKRGLLERPVGRPPQKVRRYYGRIAVRLLLRG
jgi:hypothetical protein